MGTVEYANHMEQLNAAGYTSLLMAQGRQLGLFQIMMKENRPLTSHQLADIARMKERYVREWLHGVAAGKIISYCAEKETFFIPEEYHFTLTWTSAWSEGVNVLAANRRKVELCFKEDGPDGFRFDDEEFNGAFWRMFSDMRMKTSKDYTEKYILPVLRKTSLLTQLESGINVMDVCCGGCELTVEFAKLFEKSNFTGLDLSEELLLSAREFASSEGVGLKTIQGDVHSLPIELADTYDIVLMFEALHNLPNPLKALSQISNLLKTNGMFFLLDHAPSSQLQENIGDFLTSMLYTWSINYCLPLSLSAEPGTLSEFTKPKTEPNIGYGPCWGKQNIIEALKKYFVVEEIFALPHMCLHIFVCKKAN